LKKGGASAQPLFGGSGAFEGMGVNGCFKNTVPAARVWWHRCVSRSLTPTPLRGERGY